MQRVEGEVSKVCDAEAAGQGSTRSFALPLPCLMSLNSKPHM